jgi:hypothetical protein
MIMSEFEVYRFYLALRLHFTTDQYDVIKQQGKVRASKLAFSKRKDLISIKKIAKTYSDEEVVNFLVANFVSGDRWGGMFDSEARDRYLAWKKRIESLTYTFTNDIDKIFNENRDPFSGTKSEHSYILREYLRNNISIETLVVLESFRPFMDEFDQRYEDDLVWPDLSRLIKKYKPFLKFDKDKFHAIYRRRVGFST